MRYSVFCIVLIMLAGACGRSNTSAPSQDKDINEAKTTLDPWEAESLAYRYWGTPESPYRDEARYIRFLDSLLACDTLPEALRDRAQYKRGITMLNRPGTVAGDFGILERNGSEFRLHQLHSPFTLLIFYDPECPHCNDILRALASSETLNRAIAEQKLTVIAVYAEGKREVWNKTRNDLPENWLVGYDLTGILDREIYSLPAMPTPYLLDSDKRVVLKDPQVRTLIGIISQM